MTEHTQTPWRVEEGTDLIWGACNPDDQSTRGMGYSIVQGKSGSWGDRKPDMDEREANAAFIVKAVNSHDALVRFFKWAMQEGPWEGGDLDGAAVQDKAESLGLIVSVPYDPEKHGAYNNYGCDAGDPWFEFSPQLGVSVGSGKVP